MSESAARAERFDTQSSTPASYLWEVAGKPVSVQINLDLVERLEHEVVENFRSLDSRGSEIGGVLLGTVGSGSPLKISIERYELVSCDYSRGPLYRFSDKDVERFARAIAARQGSSGPRVVGFFRSHTRKGLSLDADDITFLSQHLREPHQVALLIRPYASKSSTAGLFIWENGTMHGESSYREFPFRRADLERGAGAEAASSGEPATPAAAVVTPTPEPVPARPPVRAQIVPIASRREISLAPPPDLAPAEAETALESRSLVMEKPAAASKLPTLEKPSVKDNVPAAEKLPEPEPKFAEAAPKSSKVMWIAGACAAGVVLLGGMLVYPGLVHKPRRAAVPGQDSSALSLRVEHSQGELLLSWNRDSETVKNAAHAELTILDGTQHANVNMDLAQLQNGSIVYSPTSADVSFQLSVTGKDSSKTQSESVRVLRTRPSPMPDNSPAEKTAAIPSAPNAANPPAGNPADTGTASATPGNPNGSPSEPQQAKPAPTPLKPFAAEAILAQRLRPARPSDLPDAPRITGSEPAAITVPGMNLSGPAPLAPPVPPPAAAPGQPSPLPRQGGQIQAAEVLSRTNPEYPLAARQAHVQGSVIVEATVGADGKIKSAKAVSGPPLLQSPAVSAVRQWTYRPALLNGGPVESQTRVELKFTLGR